MISSALFENGAVLEQDISINRAHGQYVAHADGEHIGDIVAAQT